MPYIYHGRLLYVDLETGSIQEIPVEEEDVRKFFMGSGLGAELFRRDEAYRKPPLSPQSPLYILAGLLTGSFIPTACKTSFCARSPLTEIWCEATVGGYFGAMLRFAGYDGLIFTGKAETPLYLWVTEGKAELRDASHLWGLDVYRTAEAIRAETHPKAQIAAIGPAGENQVFTASVMIGGLDGRAAGRGGMGAVMGSKNLKAVAAFGTTRLRYYDEPGLKEEVRQANARIKENTVALSLWGTAGGVLRAEAYGDFPLKNWREGSWPEGAEKISGQRIRETIFVRDYRCFACPIACGKDVKLKRGHQEVIVSGPEYETVAGFGGMCLIDNLEAIAEANDLCNRLGLDTISVSSAIAFAIEAFERGLLSEKDTGGYSLRWGDPEGVLSLVEDIAYRRGLGELLAMGVRRAAEALGPQAQEFAVHVKGMEVPYHDPRAFTGMALNYATANRGACHLESLTYWVGYGVRIDELYIPEDYHPHSSRGKARMVVDFQNYMTLYNALGLCKFAGRANLPPSLLARWLNLALGWEITGEELMATGERLFNLKRALNVEMGITRADDTLPDRLLKEPRPSGGAAGVLPELESMLEEYYRIRRWDEKGKPIS
ncbi:MAG: aldehyde ferredoxin oxidoreductase family protein [Anaerolineae bacterium]|nr:aldehyde ferredoxin oxidoreductase family protein [Anaerolineae bacterium]MDW8102799.1 aldehyde ferredoxin oxidoreductase family protein [Anaerolineae bacterium]